MLITMIDVADILLKRAKYFLKKPLFLSDTKYNDLAVRRERSAA